jgi:predicted ribosome quality control (RQC) complex YloA/Tae2 family protein
MSYDFGTIKALAQALNNAYSNAHMAHLVQYGDDVFYFHLSHGGRLTFVLDNQNPYVYISDSNNESPSLSTAFSMTLRKEMGNACLLSVKVLGEDRILDFEVEVINEVFKSEVRHLIAELIPSRANLILVGGDGKVISALRMNSPSDPRPIVHGLVYEPPVKGNYVMKEEATSFDLATYNEECIAREPALGEKRKRERFHKLFLYLNNKRKSAKRKILLIQNDVAEAKTHLNDGVYGDYIYMHMDEVNPKEGFMMVEGKKVPLDPRRNLPGNAALFYKRQKKAKLTYQLGGENLAKAKKEQTEFERLYLIVQSADEAGLESLYEEFGLDQFENPRSKENPKSPLMSTESLPYETKDGDTTYLFGKSAVQNDYLSFLYDTSKKHTWMHIDGHSGSHLMIKKEGATAAEIRLGAELCCINSNLDEGDCVYCLRKDVRKGHVPGEALLSKSAIIHVDHVSEKAEKLYQSARRIEPK